MALTDYDKKNLNASQQKAVQAATDKWNAANAKGDTAGMAAAAAEAAAVRNSAGYKTDSSGNYAGSVSGGTKYANQGVYSAVSTINNNKSSGNSQYTTNNYVHTPTGSYNDVGVSDWAQKQIQNYKAQYNDAMARGDEEGMRLAHAAAEAIRAKYGYSGGADGSEYNLLPQENKVYEYDEPQPTAPQQDPRIAELLEEILNRGDFSYDVASDPLYQQYSQMYQREGDRAMRDTMAEAAAGAGGMNSYAITAAQQANNYYGSQLNDKIPELYQLAYQMYLGEKESKVQDLGLLQQLDETQYNRYQDTMNNWRADRDFAYGVYRDNVGDQQWQDSFNYNAFVGDRDYAFNSDWANKEWDYNVQQDTIANNRYDKEWDYKVSQEEKELAQSQVMALLEAGKEPPADLIAAAGMESFVEAYKQNPTFLYGNYIGASYSGGGSGSGRGSGSGSGSGSGGSDDGGNDTTGSGSYGSAASLGLGPISDVKLAGLVNEGKVIVTVGADGTLQYKWADGYNSSNYMN